MMQLRTGVGVIELMVKDGQDREDQHWGCPMREWWGLRAHQQMSPALEDRLAFTATMVSSYEAAASVAEKWGCPASDSTIHELVQRKGSQAEEQTQARLKKPAREEPPLRKAAERAILMVDGWQARFRGPGWGKKRSAQAHVEWHEIKMGVFYRDDQALPEGRGLLSEKRVVHWQGAPLELGQRLHYEALCHGLGRAQAACVLGDGSSWIWNLACDRWPQAQQTLDFYHASEHLWSLGAALYGEQTPTTQAWVEQRLHRLRHGQSSRVLKEIAQIKRPRGPKGRTVKQEQAYFAGQAARMRYKQMADQGWPIGSGAVESACRQSQNRLKHSGQFWTSVGLLNLCALEEARRNGHWNQLWPSS
jgi:hypothetical protein